jgi:cytochrome b involved in lipid metabolism
MSKRPRYFTPNEVSIHNTAKDIWVSFLGKVYDLTPFVEENAGNSILLYFILVVLSNFFDYVVF